MDYPEDFDTSAFPAGRRIALSRTVGIWIAISLFLVVCCCVAIPWLIKNRTIDPFVIYVNAPVGEWRLIGRSENRRALPYYDTIQRALIGVFAENWFNISSDIDKNDLIWSQQCNRVEVCNTRVPTAQGSSTECGIYCLADEEVYQNFKTKILPLYQTIADAGETWDLDTKKLIIMPSGASTANGGVWTLRGRVFSNRSGVFNIVAYVTVAKDIEKYPQTLGFYIRDFKAYRE